MQRHRIFAQVDAIFLLEFGCDKVDQCLVEVVAAKVRVAIGGFDFEDAVANVEDGNVERAAAKIKDGDLLVFLLVQAISE